MFTNPVKNLKAFGLRENMIVADLGAGTGFYTIPAAFMTSGGKVYAIEIQKDFLQTIINKVKEARLDNVECLWGDVERIGGTKLGDSVVDAVIASNILFQIEDKDKFTEEAKRILKIGGKLLLVDKKPDSFIHKNSNHTKSISQSEIKKIFESKGFSCVLDIDAGDHHYGIILRREK